MRLHLLQAVLMFHQNRRPEARLLLSKAESEMAALKVSQASIDMLVEMGYTASESRLGLRACGGDIDQAITHIIEKRESRRLARDRNREENLLKVGKSKNNTWVNPRSLKTLMDMGYGQDICEAALRKSNNDLAQSLTMLQDNQDQLRKLVVEDFVADENVAVSMENMGFDSDMIKMALRFAINNMGEAVEMLLKMQSEGTYQSVLENLKQAVTDATSETAGGATSAAGPSGLNQIVRQTEAAEVNNRNYKPISF